MKTSNSIKTFLFLFSLLLLLAFVPAVAQQGRPDISEMEVSSQPANQDIEMADQLRADGKIYVVVGVFLVIMAGAVAYLVRIDRKVAKLERELGR